MSKEMSLILLGVWVVIVPYLGVPEFWRTLLLVLSGVAVAVIGLLLRGETLSHGAGEHTHNTFVDHTQHTHIAADEPTHLNE